MTTMQQRIDIPLDHRLRLDLPLPEDIPAGRAEIQMTIIPYPKKPAIHKAFASLAGSLKDSATFSRDAVELQREMRDEW